MMIMMLDIICVYEPRGIVTDAGRFPVCDLSPGFKLMVTGKLERCCVFEYEAAGLDNNADDCV